MSKGRPLVRTKGNKSGKCNVCGEEGKLTEDHSPPKACVRPTAVQIRHIVNLLTDDGLQEKGRISQNGVKFRTLCHRCNNEKLGLEYDPALALFTKRIANVLNSSMQLPSVINVPGNPQLIMHAVYGHLAAQGVERYLKGPETEALRDAFLDTSIGLPENIRFYYWPFPHQRCVIFRDAAYVDLRTRDIAVIWLMKFFPITFMISWEKSDSPIFNLPSLCRWRNSSPSFEVDIPIKLTDIPHKYWPEAPTDTSAVMYGQEAMFAVPHVAEK